MNEQQYRASVVFFLAAVTFLLSHLARSTVGVVADGFAVWVTDALLWVGVVGMGAAGVLFALAARLPSRP